MAVLFAMIAAAAYGVADFAGGLAARRAATLSILLITYPLGAVVMTVFLPLYAGPLSGRTLVWATVGGVAGMAGVGLLYAGLAIAPMNIVSPITAVMSAAVPVLAGYGFGERPATLAWLGIGIGLLAVVLVSRQPDDHPHGPVGLRPLLMAVGSGVGFGLFFTCLSRSDDDSGMWPVVIARIAAAIVVVPIALIAGKAVRVSRAALGLACVAAVLDASANITFLEATRHGLLSLSSVITALYPAGTVLLAVVILKERMVSIQRYGLALGAASVVLITLQS